MDIIAFLEEMGDFLTSNWQTIFAVLIALGIVGFLRQLYRQYKLKNPVEIHFLIPRKDHWRVNYAKQDEREHLVDELVLPSNSSCLVLMWYKPKINYHENERYFECSGNLKTKPRAIKVFNPFVIEGKQRKGSPKTDENHYRDWWEAYHVCLERDRIKDEVYAGGFIVKTYDEGEYDTKIFVHTPSRLGKAVLRIKVKNKPFSETVPCIRYKQDKILKRLKRKLKHDKKHNVVFT